MLLDLVWPHLSHPSMPRVPQSESEPIIISLWSDFLFPLQCPQDCHKLCSEDGHMTWLSAFINVLTIAGCLLLFQLSPRSDSWNYLCKSAYFPQRWSLTKVTESPACFFLIRSNIERSSSGSGTAVVEQVASTLPGLSTNLSLPLPLLSFNLIIYPSLPWSSQCSSNKTLACVENI